MQTPTKRFEDQWYVVALSEEVRKGKKRPIRLFGQDIVVWRHSDGHLGAIDSRCPHMGASLAIGRVVDDAQGEVLMEFDPHVVEYRKMRQRKLQDISDNARSSDTAPD